MSSLVIIGIDVGKWNYFYVWVCKNDALSSAHHQIRQIWKYSIYNYSDRSENDSADWRWTVNRKSLQGLCISQIVLVEVRDDQYLQERGVSIWQGDMEVSFLRWISKNLKILPGECFISHTFMQYHSFAPSPLYHYLICRYSSAARSLKSVIW